MNEESSKTLLPSITKCPIMLLFHFRKHARNPMLLYTACFFCVHSLTVKVVHGIKDKGYEHIFLHGMSSHLPFRKNNYQYVSYL